MTRFLIVHIAPPQFALFFSKVVFCMVISWEEYIAPPVLASFSIKVAFSMVAGCVFPTIIAPPTFLALFPLNVPPVIFNLP